MKFESIKEEDYEIPKTCGFENGSWCNNPNRCKFRQRVYCEGPRGGISRKPVQYICIITADDG